jgi:hypothetical protein
MKDTKKDINHFPIPISHSHALKAQQFTSPGQSPRRPGNRAKKPQKKQIKIVAEKSGRGPEKTRTIKIYQSCQVYLLSTLNAW